MIGSSHRSLLLSVNVCEKFVLNLALENMKIIILLVICCFGVPADEVRNDILNSIIDFGEKMVSLPEITDITEKSFYNVVRMSMEMWLGFGAKMMPILQADERTKPNLDRILYKIEKHVEYGYVAATLLAAHNEVLDSVIRMTSNEYDRIAAHAKALSQHFKRVIALIEELIDDYRAETDESGKRKSMQSNKNSAQYEDELFKDIVRELDELWYSIINYLAMEDEMKEIEGLDNSKIDLDTAENLLTQWTDREPAKASIARLLMPQVRILQQVSHRIDALKSVDFKSRRLDWIMNLLYLENSYKYQAATCELIFIAKYLEDLDDADIPQFDPVIFEEFTAKSSFISSSFQSLDSLLKDVMMRLITDTINNSDIRIDWWDQFHKLFENGNAMQSMLGTVLEQLPAPLYGQSVDHYSAASSKFNSQLPIIVERMSSRSRVDPDDL